MGALLIPKNALIGRAVLGCGLVPNLLGAWLWMQRSKLNPYPALQILLAVVGGFALIAFLLLDYAGLMEQAWNGAQQRPGNLGYFTLLIFPGLMLMFHLRERAARAAQTRSG